MLTVLKSASGRMPPLAVQHGASTMTSAEDRGAFARVPVWVWEIETEAAGYISYQA